MIGEREDTYQDANYGDLVMRLYSIDGNEINAFYDAQNNLVFVLDNTISAQKPNVLLVINPDGDKKWDEILSSQYDVDLETIRPKVDNKYQKLDIEYSGLSVYDNLIKAYDAGDDLAEHLNQLSILRDSAARHSAMTRLNMANEIISKTNATIIKTKESIVRLETRVKTLRSKLSATKKEIGRVNTKQSASKILKLESQIEATNEKLKRAKKRLESAQKRLEIATVDAELASDLLNQPSTKIKQTTKNKPIAMKPEYPVQKFSADEEEIKQEPAEEEIEESEDEETEPQSDVKPLFDKDPQILNEDIAFKPISFDAPTFNEYEPKSEPQKPVVYDTNSEEEAEPKPVLESITPIEIPSFAQEPIAEEETEFAEEEPVVNSFEPVSDVPEFTPEPIAEEETEFAEEEPVVNSFEPVSNVPEFVPEPIAEEETKITETEPVLETMRPVSPYVETTEDTVNQTPSNQSVQTNFEIPAEVKSEHSKPGFVYYLLLLLLIGLSVFTLWLYQKSVSGNDTTPVLTVTAPETSVTEPEQVVAEHVPVIQNDDTETVFLDNAEPEAQEVVPEPEGSFESDIIESEENEQDEEPVEEPEPVDEAPFIMDAVPGRLNTSGASVEEDESFISEEEILARKPIYEPGAKHDNMFIDEEEYVHVQPEKVVEYDDAGYYYVDENGDPFFDAEEAAYQEQMYY